MITYSKLILFAATIAVALAMVVSPSIVYSLSEGPLSNRDIDQSLTGAKSNNSELLNNELTTGLAKKGNSHTSLVPPECPKQGPIPPNCTLKPKF